MKGLFKKICSLAVGLAILLPTPVFAQVPEYGTATLTQKYANYVENGKISAEELQQYSRLVQKGVLSETDLAAVLAESAVAEVIIYSDKDDGSSGGIGHAFVTIRNVRRTNITVGRLTGIEPGEMVSVGLFGNLDKDNGWHKGAFYNIETRRKASNRNNYYCNTVGLSHYVTATQLSNITSYIKGSENDYETSNYNCSHFAQGIWHEGGGTYLNGSTPATLYQAIVKKGSYISSAASMRYNVEPFY